MEIVLEAPGEKLISKSRWEEGWKEGEFFFLISLRGPKKKGVGRGGGGATDLFYPIFSGGKKDAGRYENTHFSTKDDTFKPVNIEILFLKRAC